MDFVSMNSECNILGLAGYPNTWCLTDGYHLTYCMPFKHSVKGRNFSLGIFAGASMAFELWGAN